MVLFSYVQRKALFVVKIHLNREADNLKFRSNNWIQTILVVLFFWFYRNFCVFSSVFSDVFFCFFSFFCIELCFFLLNICPSIWMMITVISNKIYDYERTKNLPTTVQSPWREAADTSEFKFCIKWNHTQPTWLSKLILVHHSQHLNAYANIPKENYLIHFERLY